MSMILYVVKADRWGVGYFVQSISTSGLGLIVVSSYSHSSAASIICGHGLTSAPQIHEDDGYLKLFLP
jgi:hypothetical protein